MSIWKRYRKFLTPIPLIAILWSLFQLYAAFNGAPHAMLFRPMHVVFAVALVFAIHPLTKKYRRRSNADDEESVDTADDREAAPRWMTAVDLFAILATAGIGLYYTMNSERISERVTFVEEVTTLDMIVGTALIILVLEACRRVMGWSLTIVVLVFLVYQMWGANLPGLLRHSGLEFDSFIDMQVLAPQGMFGVPVGVSVDYVFYFVLFAAFLEVSGAGKLFIDLALALTGRARGGPAKAAMVGSALMGSVNGSAVANVVSTGVFTIPLMKRTGYKARFAAGVEAMASTGGQILPPIMGAGAFILAQTIGWDYRAVVVAAVVPALLYFLAGYFMVHKQAERDDIQPMPVEDRVKIRDVVGLLHLLVPLAYLVYMILSGRSLMLSAFQAIIVTIIISFFRRATRLTPAMILEALSSGAQRAISVALPTAAAGIIVGVITQTNLGMRFTELILLVSGGSLILALILTMLGSIVLGLGMPTTSAYIMGAVLLTPPLIELGVPPIAAHLFIFYFACMSMLTPPVALAAFAAAGIAGSPAYQTGNTAFRISLAAYLIPYAFVLSPALLLQEGVWPAIWTGGTALIGTYALSAAVIGYQYRMLRLWERVLFFIAAVGLVYPHLWLSIGALVAFALLVVYSKISRGRLLSNTDGSSKPNEKEKISPKESLSMSNAEGGQ